MTTSVSIIPILALTPRPEESNSTALRPVSEAVFVLQHYERFAYKPFLTVIELNYPFQGELK